MRIITIIALILLSTIAFALPEGATTHADEAVFAESELRQSTVAEQLSVLSVGTFTAGGVFDKDWLIGETMHVKMDEETFNLICTDSKFVLEFYRDGVFVLAKTTGTGFIEGNTFLTGMIKVPTAELGVGSWEVVDYLWCDSFSFFDVNEEAESRVISAANSQSFQIRAASAPEDVCELPDGKVGAEKCEDGNVVQDIRTDCELSSTLVDECSETCAVGKCVSFEEPVVTDPPEELDKTEEESCIEDPDLPSCPPKFEKTNLFLIGGLVLGAIVLIFGLLRRK